MKILIALFILAISLPSFAHKGNPWHGAYATFDKTLGVGFGTAGLASAKLYPKAPGVPTTFKFIYRTDVPQLVSSATRLVAGVMDDKPLSNGAITNSGIRRMRISDTTADYKSVEFDFTITQEGVYHFFFGPWDGVTLYLGEDPPVSVEGTDGKVQWITKVAGDVAIGANPEKNVEGQPGMAVWVQQVFSPAIPKYQKFKIQHFSTVLNDKKQPQRMKAVSEALQTIGLKQ